MATYRATADGRFVNDQGQSLYQTYRAPVGSSGGTGDFYNANGVGLINGSPYSPAAQRTQPQRPQSVADLARQLRDEFRAKTEAANAANESRYQGALTLNDELRNRMLGYTDPMNNAKVPGVYDSWGAGAKLAVSQGVQNAVGDINNTMADRGIYNTSTALNRLASAGAAGGAQIADIEQRRIANKAAVDQDLTNARIGLMERKQDNAPNLDQLIQLEQMAGGGSTEGMQAPIISSGGGGGGAYGLPFMSPQSMGYSMPSSYQVFRPQAAGRRPGADAMRMASYEAKRRGYESVADMQAGQRSMANAGANLYGAFGNLFGRGVSAVKNAVFG